MSLIDKNNPSMWADGSKRSQDNGFTKGFGEPLNWRRMNQAKINSKTGSRTVERQRAAGYEVGGIMLTGRKLAKVAHISIEPRDKAIASTEKRNRMKKASI